MQATLTKVTHFAERHGLSKRQKEILQELAHQPHATSEEMAPRLACSPSTINVHLSNIFEKVGVKNKRELFQLLENKVLDFYRDQKITILCVDDDPVFQKSFLEAVSLSAGDRVQVICCDSGLEAMMYLSRSKTGEEGYPRPDVITLDLVMPTMDGMTCLQKIKSDAHYSSIPVVVFSSKSERSTINKVYDIGTNSYVLKPNSDKDLLNVVRIMLQYWGQVGFTPTLGVS